MVEELVDDVATAKAQHRATLPGGAVLSDHESAASNLLEEYTEVGV